MEFVNVFLPAVMYSLLIVLIIVLIILGIRMLETVTRINTLLDDLEKKMDSMSGLFNVMDFITTKATIVTDTVASTIMGAVRSLVKKRKQKKGSILQKMQVYLLWKNDKYEKNERKHLKVPLGHLL